MKLETEMLITIEENEKYMLLEKIVYMNRTFYYAVRVNEKDIPTGEYAIIEEIIKENEVYVQKVVEQELYKHLIAQVAINFMKDSKTDAN